MEAQKDGTCAGCLNPIVPGEEIEPAPYRRWSHVACREQTKARYMPTRRRTAPAYRLVCPDCGAAVDNLCVTETGKKRPLHEARIAAAAAPDDS